VCDDGIGMREETKHGQPTTGHFGLRGMRERAAIVRGRLEVHSRLGVGTAIELSIPAAIAYGAPARTAWFRILQRTNRNG
jgi:signal transduction histidine kinase